MQLTMKAGGVISVLVLTLLQHMVLVDGVYVKIPCCYEAIHSEAAFGATLPYSSPGLFGPLKYSRVAPAACDPYTDINYFKGSVALVVRGGGCSFAEKVYNAEIAGAIAVIVMDNVDNEGVITMGGTGGFGSKVKIPSVFVTRKTGMELASQKVERVELFLSDGIIFPKFMAMPELVRRVFFCFLGFIIGYCCFRFWVIYRKSDDYFYDIAREGPDEDSDDDSIDSSTGIRAHGSSQNNQEEEDEEEDDKEYTPERVEEAARNTLSQPLLETQGLDLRTV